MPCSNAQPHMLGRSSPTSLTSHTCNPAPTVFSCMPALFPTCSSLTPLTLHLPSTAPHPHRLHATTCSTYSTLQACLTPCVPIIRGSGQGAARTQARPRTWANNKQTLGGQGKAHTAADLNPDTPFDNLFPMLSSVCYEG